MSTEQAQVNLNEHRTMILNAVVTLNNNILPELVGKIEEPEDIIIEHMYLKYVDYGVAFCVMMGPFTLWESEYDELTTLSGNEGIQEYMAMLLEEMHNVSSYYKRMNKITKRLLEAPEDE